MERYLLLLLLLLSACSAPPPPSPGMTLSQALHSESNEGFLQADAPYLFNFPQDHAAHPGFRNEWWYLTGNLSNGDGQHYGYQVTFFRVALQPPGTSPAPQSQWATRHVWMAHVALTDLNKKQHYSEERIVREAIGLAGLEPMPYRLWVEDWQISGNGADLPWRLTIANASFALELELKPLKQIVLQGEQGLSKKSSQPGNASYYYSIPRLASSGQLTLAGQRQNVSGLSWLDREWSTSALGGDQSGWDWFALQLDSGDDLMYYRLRSKQQTTDENSAGSWITADGALQRLEADDVSLVANRWWQSPAGPRYPVGWEMEIKPLGRRFVITTPVESQQMDLTIRYWEGAIEVHEENRLIGRGYLEMTGYQD